MKRMIGSRMRRVPGRRRSWCQKDVEDASPAKRMQRGRGAAAATARKRLKDKDRTCGGTREVRE